MADLRSNKDTPSILEPLIGAELRALSAKCQEHKLTMILAAGNEKEVVTQAGGQPNEFAALMGCLVDKIQKVTVRATVQTIAKEGLSNGEHH
jgi:hypothetical protein